MELIDSLNMALEISTIIFFSREVNLSRFAPYKKKELIIDNLPYNLKDDVWLAKMLRKEQKLGDLSFDLVLKYVRTSNFFIRQRHDYECKIVKALIMGMCSSDTKDKKRFNYSSECDLIFRDTLVTRLREIGLAETAIENGIEKNVVWWREYYMRRAFENTFECVACYPILDGIEGLDGLIELECADTDHKEKWLKLRRYEYYQRHKESVDKYGEVIPDMQMSVEEVTELKGCLARMNAVRMAQIEKFKQEANWKSLQGQFVVNNCVGELVQEKRKHSLVKSLFKGSGM